MCSALCHGCLKLSLTTYSCIVICFNLFQILITATAFMELWMQLVIARNTERYCNRLTSKYYVISRQRLNISVIPLPSLSMCLRVWQALDDSRWQTLMELGVQYNRLVDWWSNRIPTKIARCNAISSRYR